MAEGDPLPEFGAAQNSYSHRSTSDWKSINEDLKVDLDIIRHQFSSRVLNVTEAEEKFVQDCNLCQLLPVTSRHSPWTLPDK